MAKHRLESQEADLSMNKESLAKFAKTSIALPRSKATFKAPKP